MEQIGSEERTTKLRILAGFAAAAFLILMHAIWAAWFSGTELAPIALAMRPDGSAGIEQAQFSLTPEMSPVLIEINTQWRGSGSPGCSYELVAPGGAVVANYHGKSDNLSAGAKDDGNATWRRSTRVARFDVNEAGRYRLRAGVELASGQKLQSAQIEIRRNASESHFFRNLGGLVLLYIALAKWRRRHEVSSAESQSPFVADDEAARARAEPLPVGERWRRRLALEGVALLVSLVRTPLVGLYTVWIAVAFVTGIRRSGGSRWEAVKAAFKWATESGALGWILPQGEYHGWAAAWVVGCAGGVVVFAIYLVTLPLRWLLPRRPRLKFRARAKRLFLAHVGMVVVAAVWWWGQSLPSNTSYEELIIGFGALSVTVLYVPALILAQITATIETAIERLEPPDAHR